jgi:DNA-binding MurR/RpiR family transcriptional regulator
MHAGPQDVFIGLTFPRYLTDTVMLAQIARDQGCGLIAITDRPSSPMAPLADVALYCQTETSYRPNCETSVLALVEALTSAVALRAPDPVQSARRTLQVLRPWLHGANGLTRIDGTDNAARSAGTSTDAAAALNGAGKKKKKAPR